MDIIKKHLWKFFAAFVMTVVGIAPFCMLEDTELRGWTFAFALLFLLPAFALLSSTRADLVLRFCNLDMRFKEVQQIEESVKGITGDLLDIIETQSKDTLALESHDPTAFEAKIKSLRKRIS